MYLKKNLTFIVLLFLLGCTSEEEKTTQEFIGHVQTLNVDEIKNMSTEDTRFYIKMTIESIVSLGNEASKKQLEQIASTLECSEEDNKCKCSFLDDNGNKQCFELKFISGYDEEGKEKLFIDIDKKYFFGE